MYTLRNTAAKQGLSGSIPSSLGELQFLQFFYIIGNNVTGKIPHSIYNISSRVNLELGDNKLEGILPPEICNGFSNLKKLYLWGNYFKGHIPVSLSNCSSLAHIDLQFNNFTGPLPSSIGKLKSLYWLAVNSNQLEANKPRDWGFIDSMTNCTNLQLFDTSNNRLRGVIPNTIANFSASIYYLRVSANPISGSIPKGIAALTNLTTLGIDQTLLGGIIPKEFGRLQNLQLLSLSNNMMVGEVPATLGNLTQMNELYLGNNKFKGTIPPELGKHMRALAVFDISNNNLVGAIPKEIISLPSLSIGINFSHNHLNGSLPLEIGFLKNTETIDLSNNKLSGEIPTTIDGCQILRNLYIGRNMMSGTIPSTLRNMRGLQVLDLSRNSFSGEVPQFMTRMALQLLNISFNNFEGQLPSEGVFMNLSTVDIRGNPKLCGGAPEIHLRKCSLDTPTHRHIPRSILVTLLSIAGAFLCLISMMLCFLSHRHSLRRLQRRKHAITVMPPQHMNISYHDLLKATSGFSSENVIGMGGFGVVYKGVMAVEGLCTSVAVKVINLEQRGASRSFLSECETLRSVRHRNLIKVLSCCSSIDQRGNDFKALVFEYMPNGSLEEWLHPKESMDQQPFESLGIMQRLNIAIDVAEALDYLHEHGPGPVVHCDLKPSNILLDNEMIAHVGDFGLARFLIRQETMTSPSMTSTGGIKGSIGYIPPEYGFGSEASVAGDIYSYGILLLETFTGVSPSDERFADVSTLHSHVKMAFPSRVLDVVDSKMFLESHCPGTNTVCAPKSVHDCLVSVLQCGLQCSKESPRERGTMKQAIRELSSARMLLLG